MKIENNLVNALKKSMDFFLNVLQIPVYLLFLAAVILTKTERNIPEYFDTI